MFPQMRVCCANFLCKRVRKLSTDVSKPLINLSIDEKSGIATVTLNKPPVNSMNLELLSELTNTFTTLERNKHKGLIITSSLNTVFSAGLDITEMCKPHPKRFEQFWGHFQQMWMKLYGSSYPTVAIINGHAPAAGCILALSCEYRIMLKNFTIGLNEAQLGILIPRWAINTTLNILGPRQTELALTAGKIFTTDEAFDVGLIDEVVSSKEDGLEKANNFLQKFSKVTPHARTATKQVLRGKIIEDLANNLQNDMDSFFNNISEEKVQTVLNRYLQSLKDKKK